jgi:nicotinate dehydrogenase subunit B
MTEAEQAAEEGLEIVGPVVVGFPSPRGGYATTAYGDSHPQGQAARWLMVRPNSSVTAYAGKVEYGQGVRGGFTIEVADELRLPLSAVEVVLGDTDEVPWDLGTFGSQSTGIVGLQLRKAAATARQALLELAAERLDLATGDLMCREGRVVSRSDPNRSLSYGDLVAGRQLRREVSDDAPLTPAEEFTVMGKPAQRLDALARVTGRATYTRDILLPGMLFAAVVRPLSYGARLTDVDSSTAERMPGVVQVVQDDDLLAVLAETDEQAQRAASTVQAGWEEERDRRSHLDMPDLLLGTRRDAAKVQESGSLEDGFRQADAVLEEMYYLPYITNMPMEPRAAVAHWDGGRLTVWAGTQRPFGLRTELAAHFGLEERNVRVIAPEIGGGFGAKNYYPVGLEAARLAKAVGRPVRVAYTRAEDTAWGTFRPAALIEVKSGFKTDGTIVGWEFRAYHAGDRAAIGRRGSETPYGVPHVAVTVYSSESPLRVGSYRSLGGAVNHFAREAHVDEIAHAVGIDPVELRLRNLTHPRFRRVLEAAARRFGWTKARPPSDRGVGVAIGLDVGSYTASCVQLDVQGSEVKVERVVTVLDCGLTVNPDGVRNQVEGSIIMGMGAALYEAVEFRGGSVLNPGFLRYRVPRINDSPAIEVVLVGDPEEPSTGAGEPAIVPIAAAISNAVFDRTGKRVRELPLQRHLR